MPTETRWHGIAWREFLWAGTGVSCEPLSLEIDPLWEKRKSCSRVEARRKVSGQRPSGLEEGFPEMKFVLGLSLAWDLLSFPQLPLQLGWPCDLLWSMRHEQLFAWRISGKTLSVFGKDSGNHSQYRLFPCPPPWAQEPWWLSADPSFFFPEWRYAVESQLGKGVSSP